MEKPINILKQYWGFDTFRDKQKAIISSVLEEKDCLALLPTGGGKSICFQVPALIHEGLCLVVSPLIALMEDQVNQLQKRGIKAAAITSAMSKRQIDIALDNAIYGELKFLYVSPERLQTRLFKARFEKMKINLIAVDEAHCISEWGYDFRPAYLSIANLRELKPKTTVLALTATATPDVVDDIQAQLKFRSKQVIRKSFERSNLIYNIELTNNKINRLIHFISNKSGSGIIYCRTRRSVKTVCNRLLIEGFNVDYYHAGLRHEERRQKQKNWTIGKTQIIVSTNAFGMGIDKPDVQFVLHYDIPQSPEAYFQEAGRAGRDGKPAEALLYYTVEDLKRLEESIDKRFPPIALIKRIYDALGNHFQLAVGSGEECSFPIDIAQFSEKYNQPITITYNALKFLELCGFIELSENYNQPSQIKILSDQAGLYSYQVRDKEINTIILFLLRSEMGIFENYARFDENKIAKKTGLPRKTILQKLQFLNDAEVIDYIPRNNQPTLTYKTERLAPTHFSIDPTFYHKRKKVARSKIGAMIDFASSKGCTSQFLLNYFGETDGLACGQCSYCKHLEKRVPEKIKTEPILTWCKINCTNHTGKLADLIKAFPSIEEQELLIELRYLSEHGIIKLDVQYRLITYLK